jgi:hypothetical protein
MKRVVVLLCLIFGISVRPSTAQSPQADEPEANPGRPTVSTLATLTLVGYVQFETGSQMGDCASRCSFNFERNIEVTSVNSSGKQRRATTSFLG